MGVTERAAPSAPPASISSPPQCRRSAYLDSQRVAAVLHQLLRQVQVVVQLVLWEGGAGGGREVEVR